MTQTPATVGIIMGSQSDWPTMREAAQMLDALEVPYEARSLQPRACLHRGKAGAGAPPPLAPPAAAPGRRLRRPAAPRQRRRPARSTV